MPSPQVKQYHAFLSHNSSDKTEVELLAVRLEDEAGLKPFLDKWHLVPGEPWQEALEEALNQSETCAVFLGASGLGSWENEEMRAALDERVRNKAFRVIPVFLPGAEPKDESTLPRFLRRLTWVDFRAGLDDCEAFSRLVAGIQGISPGRSYSKKQPPSSEAQQPTHSRKVRFIFLLPFIIVLSFAGLAVHSKWFSLQPSAPQVNAAKLEVKLLLRISGFRVIVTNSGETIATNVVLDMVAWRPGAPGPDREERFHLRDLNPNADTTFDVEFTNKAQPEEYRKGLPTCGYFVASCGEMKRPQAWAFHLPVYNADKEVGNLFKNAYSTWPMVEFSYPDDKPYIGSCVNYPTGACKNHNLPWSPKSNRNEQAYSSFEIENRIKRIDEVVGLYKDSTGLVVLIGRESSSQVEMPLTIEDVASIFRLTKSPTLDAFGCAFEPKDDVLSVRCFGGVEDSHLGFVLYSADLALKQYVMGVRLDGKVIQSSVRGYQDILQQSRQDANEMKLKLSLSRFWFENAPVLHLSTNGHVAILEKTGVIVACEQMIWQNGRYIPVAPASNPTGYQALAEFFTNNYNKFTQEEPTFAALTRIVQITALASQLTQSEVNRMRWIEDYVGKKYVIPTEVPKLQVNIEKRQKMEGGGILSHTISMSGGVSLTTRQPQTRTADDDRIIEVENGIKEKMNPLKTGSVFTLHLLGTNCVGFVLYAP